MNDDELKRHFDVLAEAAETRSDRILEALSLLDEKVDRYQTENRQEFAETGSMIKLSYPPLDQRLTTLESRVGRIESVLFPEGRQ
ncbi:MAG: hypothetical protein WBX15_00080 [Thermoanaerobaculia bacterium]